MANEDLAAGTYRHMGRHQCTLRLRIPLTLAIVPALIVHSNGQSFAVPQGALSELVHLSPEQVAAQVGTDRARGRIGANAAQRHRRQ